MGGKRLHIQDTRPAVHFVSVAEPLTEQYPPAHVPTSAKFFLESARIGGSGFDEVSSHERGVDKDLEKGAVNRRLIVQHC